MAISLPDVPRFDLATTGESRSLREWLNLLRAKVIAGGGGGASPGGPDKAIQYNNAGAFGGTASLLYDGSVTVTTGGTSFRVKGDMSNATLVNRFAFQTSTPDSPTRVMALPSGIGVTATFNVSNASDPTNANFCQIGVNAGGAVVSGGVNGIGTPRTLTLTNNGINGIVLDVNANTQIQRGLSTPVVSKTANYTAVQTDHVIFCDCTGGSFTVTLFAANIAGAGFSPTLRIKRTDSSANTVTVTRAGADTIDGVASIVLGALQACDLESDGVSKWGIIDISPSAGAAATFDWGKYIAGQQGWPQG